MKYLTTAALVLALTGAGCASLEPSTGELGLTAITSSSATAQQKQNKLDQSKSNWTQIPNSWSARQIDLHTGSETRYSDLAYMLATEGYPISFEPNKANEKLGNPMQYKGSVSALVKKLAEENNWVINYEDSTAQLREFINLKLVLEDKGITDKFIGALMTQQGYQADTSVAGIVRLKCNKACTEKLKDIAHQFNASPIALTMSASKWTFNANKPVQFSDIFQAQGQSWPGKVEVYESVASESAITIKLSQAGLLQPVARNLTNILPGSRILLKELGLDIGVNASKNIYKINLRSEQDKFNADLLTSGTKKIAVVTPKDKTGNQTLYVLTPSTRMLNPVTVQKEALE